MTVRTHRRVAVTVLAILSTVALALAGCGSHPSPGSSTPVDVVATENFWGDITKQIGGDHVNVDSVISDPNADPHLYESDAKTAAAVSKARLVIVNGLGYDAFMDRLLSASPNHNRTVLTAADVMQISGPDANPHIWYDIAKLPAVALAIAAQLSALDPGDAATFTAKAKTFSDSLAPINAAIAGIKRKHAGAPVGYTERVPGYLIEAAENWSWSPRSRSPGRSRTATTPVPPITRPWTPRYPRRPSKCCCTTSKPTARPSRR